MIEPLKTLQQEQHERWKEQNVAHNEQIKQAEQERHNRQMQTIERVKTSGLSRDGYAVYQLLDASRRGEVDIEEIQICDLGYPMDIRVWRDINSLFEKLIEDGCIKSFHRKTNRWIKVLGLNKKCLEEKIKQYHPSNIDPSVKRRSAFELIAAIAAIFSVIGVVGALVQIVLQNRRDSDIKAIEARLRIFEDQYKGTE